MERGFLYVAGALAQCAAAAYVGFASAFRNLKNCGWGELVELAAVVVVGISAQLDIQELCEMSGLDASMKKKDVATAIFERRGKHGKSQGASALRFEFQQHAVHEGGAEFFAADIADISFPAEEFEQGSLFKETCDADAIAES